MIIGTCKTNGAGFWTMVKQKVNIVKFEIGYLDGNNLLDSAFGELRVYFDDSWNNDHGLIYTDPQWLRELRKLLIANGFSKEAAQSVSYSEMGMQGTNYVSCDISKNFIRECDKFLSFITNTQKTIHVGVCV